MMAKCCKFLLVLLFLHQLLNAQKWDYPYTRYTKLDGLPSNNIYCITSDTNGVLWIGTDAGIARFDGNSIKTINSEDGLPSNDVFEIFCDKKNRLWITTFKSDITYIQNNIIHTKRNDTLIQSIGNKNSLPRSFEDSEGNVWIRTNPFSLYKIDKIDKIERITSNLFKDDYYNITELNKKLYFFSFYNTIIYNLKTNILQNLPSKNKIKIDGLNVYNNKCYYINKNNSLSVGDTSLLSSGSFTSKSLNWNIPIVDSSLWVLSKNGFKVYDLYKKSAEKTFLTSFPVSFFHQDKQKNIWIATLTNGLFKLDSKYIQNYTGRDNTNVNTFSAINVSKFFLFLGSNNGEILVFNRRSLKLLYKFSINLNTLTSYRILKIVERFPLLYVATDRGMFTHPFNSQKFAKIPLSSGAVKNCFIQNDSLIVLDNIGVLFWSINKNITIDTIMNRKRFYSYIEYKGKKIVGSQDSLYYIDKTFKPYPLNIPFNFRPVDLLVKDSILIATTAEKGIFFISDSTVIKNINNSNGLSSNTCYKSVLYKNSLYTATNKGINIYNFENDSIIHIFESDGLPSNTVYDLSVYSDTIYAATEAGLSVIPLQAVQVKKNFPLFVNPVIHGTDTLWDLNDLKKIYTNDYLQIVLNPLSFGSKTAIKFYYRTRQLDTTFKTTVDQNISLKFPSPGLYTFEAFAENGEGLRSNIVMLQFNIQPYFYQTNLFKILLVLSGLVLAFAIYKLLLHIIKQNEKRKTEVDTKIRNLELDAWKSTINPHFMFNSLNTMQGLFQSPDDFKSANSFLFEFSGLLRKTIDHSSKLLIKIEEEITYLENYLQMEKIKRNGKLNYRITLDNEIMRPYYIPSLLIQPVVENSVKHGIQDKEEGSIQVDLELQGDTIHCSITDDGKGFNRDFLELKQDSKGIKLIKSKIDIVEKLIKKKIGFSYSNRFNAKKEIIGTETTFSFPLIIFDHVNLSSDR